MEFIPGNYYFVRPIRGGQLIPVKAVEPVRYIKDAPVGRGIHVLTGKPVAVYPDKIVKQTDKPEIAKATGRNVDMIL